MNKMKFARTTKMEHLRLILGLISWYDEGEGGG